MARRDDIVAFADELLDVAKWQEFAPAGLQVVGADEVSRIACGVSSSLELFERAAVEELADRVREAVDREPLVFAEGHSRLERVAVSTGAGGYDLIAAAHEGYDCLVTGEPEEPSLHTARELGIHLIAAGHYATERLGVQALAAPIGDPV